MKLTWIFCFLNIYLLLQLSECRKNVVAKAFARNGIVPDVTEAAPKKIIQIRYLQSNKAVSRGNELAPKDVRKEPEISYSAHSTFYHTLVMLDPDAPSRASPTERSVLHWLVVNIPGSAVARGETLTEYFGAAPKENTGLHRYVFLLYRQPRKIKFDEPFRNSTHGSTRPGFSVKNFVVKYNLGKPIAGNFFKAQYDDTVPDLYKQLTS